jgi:hypothetical protein
MLKCVEGIYRNGEVELLEAPPNVTEARVIVAFLEPSPGATRPALSREELAELRGKLAAWEEDWNAPGMVAYDAL